MYRKLNTGLGKTDTVYILNSKIKTGLRIIKFI